VIFAVSLLARSCQGGVGDQALHWDGALRRELQTLLQIIVECGQILRQRV
jgi:hypothetical protein